MIATGNARKAVKAFSAGFISLALALFSSIAWSQAGYVHEISGSIFISKGGAKAVPAKVGETFDADTVFSTGADGKMVLKFADGQVVALGADSGVRIGKYNYVAHDLRQSNSSIELMHGEMRFVAGLIGATHREGVHIAAGDSSVRIQSAGGADFTVQVNPGPAETGAAVVALGEISVHTPYGPIYRVEPSQYAPWQPERKLSQPMPVAAAPAVVQAAVAELWTTIVPVNTPVVVASTARMAAMAAAASQPESSASPDLQLIGYVYAVSNKVSVRTPSGKTIAAKPGDTFRPGTTFNTGTDGQVVLKFADGQLVVLGPASTLGVDQYHFDPHDLKASSTALDLADGAMRYVSGAIHAENREGVSISAGASLVDILNTGLADFSVVVDSKAKAQEIGIASVAAGAVSVHTPYGPISKIEPGQAVPWQPGRTSQAPEPLAAAPAAVQAAISALAAVTVPDNSPVAVVAAARAAAAAETASRAQAAAGANPDNAQLRAAAQAAVEQANVATQAATTAAQAVEATVFASTLASLPATAAGPAQVQVPPPAPALAPPAAPINPTVTPGGGGTCVGSKC